MFNIKGSIKRFPTVKEEFINDSDDLAKRSIMDGDPFLASNPSWRFKSPEVEPYMSSQAAGSPWFKTKRVTKEQYKEMLEKNREEESEEDLKRDKVKKSIDAAWD